MSFRDQQALLSSLRGRNEPLHLNWVLREVSGSCLEHLLTDDSPYLDFIIRSTKLISK